MGGRSTKGVTNYETKNTFRFSSTLDGFIEGKNGEVDWCITDSDMGFVDFLNQIDTILYGRKSYDLWGEFTPETELTDTEKEMWELYHSKEKYVFSRTKKGTDNKAIFINDNILEEVNKLKNKPGKDMWLYGGTSLITTFMNLGLVDEFRLSVQPGCADQFEFQRSLNPGKWEKNAAA